MPSLKKEPLRGCILALAIVIFLAGVMFALLSDHPWLDVILIVVGVALAIIAIVVKAPLSFTYFPLDTFKEAREELLAKAEQLGELHVIESEEDLYRQLAQVLAPCQLMLLDYRVLMHPDGKQQSKGWRQDKMVVPNGKEATDMIARTVQMDKCASDQPEEWQTTPVTIHSRDAEWFYLETSATRTSTSGIKVVHFRYFFIIVDARTPVRV